MSSEGTPSPAYILRGHTSQINSLSFSPDNRWLYSGDAAGYVIAWDMQTFRPAVCIRGHAESVLTVLPWTVDTFISHGRDNKIHAWKVDGRELADAPSVTIPTELEPIHTIETNALGYCKCSLVRRGSADALIAVPATLQDDLVDIFHLPSCKRVYRSVGKGFFSSKTGTVMALQLFTMDEGRLGLACVYEDGRFALFRSNEVQQDCSAPVLGEGEGWSKVFERREHREPAMGIALDRTLDRAWSVSADNLVVRYDLKGEEHTSRAYKTAYPGRGGIAVRDDGKILAVAGWDGMVRVHAARTFRPLAVLEYHRDSVFTVAFSNDVQVSDGDDSNRALLAGAGKDGRISLWELYPPSNVIAEQ